jgi:hypothetical protein
LRVCQDRIVGKLREMTGKACLHEGETRIAPGHRHAGDETIVTIDISALDPHALPEQERPCERPGLTAERLTEFRCVDALESDADPLGLAGWNQLERVTVGN